MSDMFKIPAEFWQQMTEDESLAILKRGTLTREQAEAAMKLAAETTEAAAPKTRRRRPRKAPGPA